MMDETAKQEPTCYEKATAKGEPVFVLRASDISSPLVVTFWVTVQQRLKMLMDSGATMTEALEAIRVADMIPSLSIMPAVMPDKEGSALEIAKQMQDWPTRKLAD